MENSYEIALEYPCAYHKDAVFGYLQEHIGQGEYSLHGARGLDIALSYEQWLDTINRASPGERGDLSSTFFAIRKSDGKLLGTIDIRLKLRTPHEKRLGHIDYGVRPMERNKGYATGMLRIALDHCAYLGAETIFASCSADCLPARRTIEKCGGMLKHKDEHLCRYEIAVQKLPLVCDSDICRYDR